MPRRYYSVLVTYALLSADKAQLIAVDGLGLAKYAQTEGHCRAGATLF